jgi:colanic acid biosynthesis glycosyl transferase WcaI
MGKVIILTELYYPEQSATGFFLTQIAEGLADEFAVWVITGPATVGLQPTRAPDRERRHGVSIVRCAGTSFNKNALPGRLANMLSRTATMFWRALRICRRGDVVIAVTNPPLLPFLVLLLKWVRGCHFVLLIHDVYPEALVAAGLLAPSSPALGVGQLLNRVLYRSADRIITLGRDMSRLVREKLTTGLEKIRCIPHWFDPDGQEPRARQSHPVLTALGLAEQFVVLYAGNMGRTHDVEIVARAVEALRGEPAIQFIFMGAGAKKLWLEGFVRERGLANVLILPPCPQPELMDYLSACDLAVIAFVPGMAGVSVPSRMYNQMAAARPLLAVTEAWSELGRVVCEEQIGWVVQPGDDQGLVTAIRIAAERRQSAAVMGERAACAAREKYHFAQSIAAYKRLCRELLGHGR